MSADAKLASFGRAAYYSLAVAECWMLGGVGVLGLMIASGQPFFPSEHAPGDARSSSSAPNLIHMGEALGLLLFAVPAAIGLLAMSQPDFPRRAGVVRVSGILMVVIAVFCVTALAIGWHL